MKFYEEKRRDSGVVEVILNRPDLHNAFNDEFIEQLTTAFNSYDQDDSVRAVLLSAYGKSFCAGADLNWMKKMINYSVEENIEDSKKLAGLFHAINDCSKPVVAKVHGAALGGGVGIVAACDYVIAAEGVMFGFTEVRLGIVPAVISPFVVSKIGNSYARAYFLSGKRFAAERALQMQLIHEVVPRKELDFACEQQLKEYLKAGPQATAYAKELIKEITELGPKDCHDYTYQLIAKLRVSEEGQEGMNALLEKRVPSWSQKE